MGALVTFLHSLGRLAGVGLLLALPCGLTIAMPELALDAAIAAFNPTSAVALRAIFLEKLDGACPNQRAAGGNPANAIAGEALKLAHAHAALAW
jgi:hypothetical protein